METDRIATPDTVTVVTTAMQRPELLRATYSSFFAHLRGIDLRACQLLINIDPAPSDGSADEVADIATEFFDNVDVHQPREPNFAKAIQWLWARADTKYILHLEDDWVLVNPVDANDMLRVLEKNSHLHQVRFRTRTNSDGPKKVGLAPSFIRDTLYRPFQFDPKVNPEVQLHQMERWDKFGIKHPRPRVAHVMPKQLTVKDIGRQWARERNIQKRGQKFQFTRWK